MRRVGQARDQTVLPFRAKNGGRRTLTCNICGQAYQIKASHAANSKYCSKACQTKAYLARAHGATNPNFKGAFTRLICQQCGGRIKTYNKHAKYCSRQCSAEATQEAFRTMRRRARKDDNHREIVEAFQKIGCLVLDMSHAGGGWPDLIVNDHATLRMVEIKNPKTSYGRRGLNALQQKFAGDSAAQMAIVRTVDDVIALVGQWRRQKVS